MTAILDSLLEQKIMNATEDMIVFIDREYRYRFANDAYYAFHGIESSHLLGKEISGIVGEENFQKFKPLLDRAMRGEAFTKKDTFELPDGTQRFEEGRFAPLRDNAGEIIGATVTIREITEQELAIARAEEESRRAAHYLEIVGVIMVSLDKNARVTLINKKGSEILGYSEAELQGRNWIDTCIPGEIREEVHHVFREVIAGKIHYPHYHENEVVTKSGERRLIAWHNVLLREKSGEIIGTLSSGEDITDRRRQEEKLRQFAAIVENTTEGAIITDAQNRIIALNPAFLKITGYSEAEVLGKTPAFDRSGIHSEDFYRQMWASIETTGKWSGEIWNRRKDGSNYPLHLSISTIYDAEGKVVNYIGVFTDLSLLRASEEQRAHQALHDALTDIPNRLHFATRLRHAVEGAQRNGNKVALYCLDLDDFKIINDTYGHDMGDSMLLEVVQRLESVITESETLARFSGDSFVLFSERNLSVAETAQKAQQILQLFQKPFVIEDRSHFIGASIGVSIFPDDTDSADELIKLADTAMHRAKSQGKNQYTFYTQELTEALFERMMIENSIREAIATEQFELLYQPQVSLSERKIVGFEALIRWNHSALGVISPLKFIPVAEKNRLIIPLGAWILREACTAARAWHEKGLFDGRISVNVSGVQLEDPDFMTIVQETLAKTKLPPAMLELEITESVLMKDPQRWIAVLDALRDLGISIAIDDFGTGYSSLAYLRHLPLSKLKIDKSFIDDIPVQSDACAIAKTVVALAESLGFSTLAEGVEREEQLAYLESLGCDAVQGYIFDKPLRVEDATQRLKPAEIS